MNPITSPVRACFECDRDGEWIVAIYSPDGTEHRLRNRTVHGKLCHVYACSDGLTRAIPQETDPTTGGSGADPLPPTTGETMSQQPTMPDDREALPYAWTITDQLGQRLLVEVHRRRPTDEQSRGRPVWPDATGSAWLVVSDAPMPMPTTADEQDRHRLLG
jgi:hypothetical protein